MDTDANYIPGNEEEVEQPSSKREPQQLSPLALRFRPPPQVLDSKDEEWNPEEGESISGDSIDERAVSPLKRAADDTVVHRPLKRQKAQLNTEYLDLLNRDIEDASYRVNIQDQANLAPSQLGLTFWSGIEKKVFFESLGRLGRDNLEGVAARVGTKSVIEIRHYLRALEDELNLRQRTGQRPALLPAEYPAAIELSQQCCYALDEAADAISLRQEGREQQREENRWGHVWNLTPEIAKRLDHNEQGLLGTRNLPSVKFFHLSNWLKLSQRFFMNSSIPGDNWNHIDNVPPSIWATTFEDFYSLAVSFTRRIVQSAIFTSMSRIRAKSVHRPTTRNIIRRQDIEAALESLGVAANSKEFWRKSARRLRLDVYDSLDENDEPEIMSFQEVECALPEGLGLRSDLALETDDEANVESEDDTLDQPEDQEVLSATDEEEAAINTEANEVFRYSAADFPETFRMKGALNNRIAMERQQEKIAEECDQYASYKEEQEMWDLLQRAPATEMPKKADPGPPPRSNLDVESLYPLGRNWRSNTRYWSEWELRGNAARGKEHEAV